MPNTCRSERDNVASRQAWREPACRREIYAAVPFVGHFFFYFFAFVGFFLHYRYIYEVRSRSMYIAQPAQSPLHKAASQVCADQSTYQKKYVVRTCMWRPVVFLRPAALGICKSPVCAKNVGPSMYYFEGRRLLRASLRASAAGG